MTLVAPALNRSLDGNLSGLERFSRGAKSIGSCALDLIEQSAYTSIALNILNLVTQVSILTKHNILPLVNFFLAPVSLYHAFADAGHRISLMINSLRIKDFANGFYFGCQAVDSCGTTLGVISKGITGTIGFDAVKKLIAMFNGKLTHAAVSGLGVTFNLALPIVMIAAGFIGAIASSLSVSKVVRAYRQFKRDTVDKSYDSVYSILKTLQGPQGSGTEDKVNSELFRLTHATSDGHYDELQQRIQTVFQQKATYLNQLNALKSSIEIKDQKLFEGNDYLAQVNNLIEICEELGETDKVTELTLLKTKITENYQQGIEIIEQTEAEMRRIILNYTIIILSSLATLAAGIIALTSPHLVIVTTVIGSTTGVIEISMIVCDKAVSAKRWRSLELALHIS